MFLRRGYRPLVVIRFRTSFLAERSVVPAPGSPDADSLLGLDVDVPVTGDVEHQAVIPAFGMRRGPDAGDDRHRGRGHVPADADRDLQPRAARAARRGTGYREGPDTDGEPAPAPGAELAAGVPVAQDVTTTSAKTGTATRARDDGVVMLRI